MTELIDKMKLLQQIAEFGREIPKDQVIGVIARQEDVEVEDRPKGEWKSVKASIYPYGYDVECSVCGRKMGSSFGYKYCPNCGAEMKGDTNV